MPLRQRERQRLHLMQWYASRLLSNKIFFGMLSECANILLNVLRSDNCWVLRYMLNISVHPSIVCSWLSQWLFTYFWDFLITKYLWRCTSTCYKKYMQINCQHSRDSPYVLPRSQFAFFREDRGLIWKEVILVEKQFCLNNDRCHSLTEKKMVEWIMEH